MRFIDGTVGWLLVTLLAVVSRLFRATRTNPSADPGHILVMKFFGIGSIQYSSPLLHGLRLRYPRARLCFLTFQQNVAFVNLMPDVDVALGVRTSSIKAFALDTLRHLLWLRRHHVEIVIDLEFFSKYSTVLSLLSGAPCRVGYYLDAFWRRSLLTHAVSFDATSHIVDCVLKVAQVLNLCIERRLFPLMCSQHDSRHLSDLLETKISLTGEPVIVVNVNAGDTSLLRRWPAPRFAQLVERLSGKGVFVFTGVASERTYVQSVIDMIPAPVRAQCVNLAGELTPAMLVALFRLANVLVTNDTGPLHVAAGEACPCVAIFGPESPLRYGPLSACCRMVYLGLPCSPCIGFDNGKRTRCHGVARCVSEVTVAQVLQPVEEILAARGTTSPTSTRHAVPAPVGHIVSGSTGHVAPAPVGHIVSDSTGHVAPAPRRTGCFGLRRTGEP